MSYYKTGKDIGVVDPLTDHTSLLGRLHMKHILTYFYVSEGMNTDGIRVYREYMYGFGMYTLSIIFINRKY